MRELFSRRFRGLRNGLKFVLLSRVQDNYLTIISHLQEADKLGPIETLIERHAGRGWEVQRPLSRSFRGAFELRVRVVGQ